MKVPDKIRTNCPKCKKHTQHKVRQARKGKEKRMNWGRRQYERVKAGYGGSPRTPKKPVFKIGKRTVLLLECGECNKKRQKVYSARTKKTVEVGK
ncbi:MAG: 50S ribosomal protein L44e [Candidatus Altiarchaeales archaeon]|nr:50S ribosomal protein L44e [Candidatus Altiarchaeales archaeon]